MAKDLYVSKTGDDSVTYANNDINNPWLTIGHGVATWQSGDTLWVRSGTYYEWVVIATGGAAGSIRTLKAYPDETVVIDGQTTRTYGISFSSGVNYVTVDGFEIQYCKTNGIASWYNHNNNNITIQNCNIHNNGDGTSSNPKYEGGIAMHAGTAVMSDITIDNNRIHHNYNVAITFYCDSGSFSSSTISNNLCYFNPSPLRTDADNYQLHLEGATSITIHDNYFYFCQKSNRIENIGSNFSVYNNVFAYNGFCGLDLNSSISSSTFKNNIFAYNGYHGSDPKTSSNNNKYYNNVFYRNLGSGLYALYTSTGLQTQNNIYLGGCTISAVYNDTTWGTKDWDDYYDISSFGTTETNLQNVNPLFTNANNFNFTTSVAELQNTGNNPSGDGDEVGLNTNFVNNSKVIPFLEATVDSSNYSAGNPSRTVDRKYSAGTTYAFVSNATNAWIVYDLGSSKSIQYIGLFGAGQNGYYSPNAFHIATSDDNVSYTNRLDANYVNPSNDAWSEMMQWFELPAAVSARYVKLTIDSSQQDYSAASNPNVSVSEFFILGPIGFVEEMAAFQLLVKSRFPMIIFACPATDIIIPIISDYLTLSESKTVQLAGEGGPNVWYYTNTGSDSNYTTGTSYLAQNRIDYDSVTVTLKGTITKVAVQIGTYSGPITLNVQLYDSSGNILTGHNGTISVNGTGWKETADLIPYAVSANGTVLKVAILNTNAEAGNKINYNTTSTIGYWENTSSFPSTLGGTQQYLAWAIKIYCD